MDTKELKRLAEAATPGPWRATQNYVIAEETPDRLGFRLPTRNFNGNREDGRKFGAYIAAANPAAILALIARVTELEAAAGAPDLRSAIDERAAFEKWAMSPEQDDFCLDWTGNDPFDHGHTMDAWKAWQARAHIAQRAASGNVELIHGELPVVREFQEWLNDQRMRNVSEAFHEIVTRFRKLAIAAPVAAEPAPDIPAQPGMTCWCATCRPITMADMRMVLCPTCGNKRCPHAADHRDECTNSNESGQVGSSHE